MLITSHVITRSRARLVTTFNSSYTKQRNKLTITIHIVTNSTIHHIIVTSPYLTSSIKCVSSTLTIFQRRTRDNTKPIRSFGRNIQVINRHRNKPNNNLIRQRRFTTALMIIINRRQTTSTERHNITSRRMSKRTIRRVGRVTRHIAVRIRQHIVNIRTSTILIRVSMEQRLPRPQFPTRHSQRNTRNTLITSHGALILVTSHTFQVPTNRNITHHHLLRILRFKFNRISNGHRPIQIRTQIPIRLNTLSVIINRTMIMRPLRHNRTTIPVLSRPRPIIRVNKINKRRPRSSINMRQTLLHFGRTTVRHHNTGDKRRNIKGSTNTASEPLKPLYTAILLATTQAAQNHFNAKVKVRIRRNRGPVPHPIHITKVRIGINRHVISRHISTYMRHNRPVIRHAPSTAQTQA